MLIGFVLFFLETFKGVMELLGWDDDWSLLCMKALTIYKSIYTPFKINRGRISFLNTY